MWGKFTSYGVANKWKKSTGLPVNIWIDENRVCRLHDYPKCIWFQLNDDEKPDLDNSTAMDLDGVTYPEHARGLQLSSYEIRCVRNWALNNRYALDLVADVLLDLDDIFPYMIKGGDPASPEEIEALRLKCEELRHP